MYCLNCEQELDGHELARIAPLCDACYLDCDIGIEQAIAIKRAAPDVDILSLEEYGTPHHYQYRCGSSWDIYIVYGDAHEETDLEEFAQEQALDYVDTWLEEESNLPGPWRFYFDSDALATAIVSEIGWQEYLGYQYIDDITIGDTIYSVLGSR